MLTTQTATRTCTPARRGFPSLPCPRCGDEAAIKLDLTDLADDAESLECTGCEATFSIATIRALVNAWAPVLKWLDLAPEAAE